MLFFARRACSAARPLGALARVRLRERFTRGRGRGRAGFIAANRVHQLRRTARPRRRYCRRSGWRRRVRTGTSRVFGRRLGLMSFESSHIGMLRPCASRALIQRNRRRSAHSARLRNAANKEGLPLRAALPLSGRGPVARGVCLPLRIVSRRRIRSARLGPRQRRGSSSRMPATAAIDNETLDHLLSVVAWGHQCAAPN